MTPPNKLTAKALAQLRADAQRIIDQDSPVSDREWWANLLNAITELQERREADEWILLVERFPEDETVILVADSEGVVWGAEVQDGVIYPDDWAHMKGFGSREATRWKPMPKANKQVG